MESEIGSSIAERHFFDAEFGDVEKSKIIKKRCVDCCVLIGEKCIRLRRNC